jgi:hypothetical protein
MYTLTRRIFIHLSLRQLTGKSQKKNNDGVLHKTGGEDGVLLNLKLLLNISIVNSHYSYIKPLFH